MKSANYVKFEEKCERRNIFKVFTNGLFKGLPELKSQSMESNFIDIPLKKKFRSKRSVNDETLIRIL